jgi:tetratricopeptide (TPR) repeat protein
MYETRMTQRFFVDATDPTTAYRIDPKSLLPVPENIAGMQARCEALAAEAIVEPDSVIAAEKASKAGILLMLLGRTEDAKRTLEFALARQVDPSQLRGRTVTEIRLAQTLLRLGQGEEAVDLLSGVVERCRQDNRLASLLHFALQHLGKAQWELGHADEARSALQEALSLRQETGDADLVESTRMALRLLPGAR